MAVPSTLLFTITLRRAMRRHVELIRDMHLVVRGERLWANEIKLRVYRVIGPEGTHQSLTLFDCGLHVPNWSMDTMSRGSERKIYLPRTRGTQNWEAQKSVCPELRRVCLNFHEY